MDEQDVLRYFLRMPGERAALLILLSSWSLDPAPDVGVVMESLLIEKNGLSVMEWASSVARVNLMLRQRLEWPLEACERLIGLAEQALAAELIAASRPLLQLWQKTAQPTEIWEPDSEAPPWHDLSPAARLKLVRVFLGLLAVPLDTPYEPKPPGDNWTVRFLSTMLVGASLVQRGAVEMEEAAELFSDRLTPTLVRELSEIASAAGASERQHEAFPVHFSDNLLN